MIESVSDHPRPGWSERCIYAAYLGSGVFALALVMLACGSGRFMLLLHAALALVAALLFRARLIIDGQLAACAEEDDSPESKHRPGESDTHSTFTEPYDELDRLRGTPRLEP